MIEAKIIKIESNHDALRTNEMIGQAVAIPEVGKEFIIFGESLTPGMNTRIIRTTKVQECTWDFKTRKFTFKTLNSTYEVAILDEKLTEKDILSSVSDESVLVLI